MESEKRPGILRSKRVGNVVVIIFLLAVAYYFGVRGMRFFAVPSESMVPTLEVGDQLVTLKEKEYHRGDIVVFRDATGEYFVKRIAGVGGDSLMIAEGALFINESYTSEPYIKEPMVYTMAPAVPIPEGEYFMLGDNRNNSEDSSVDRSTVPHSRIVGKVVFRHFPYGRWGRIASYPLEPVAAY